MSEITKKDKRVVGVDFWREHLVEALQEVSLILEKELADGYTLRDVSFYVSPLTVTEVGKPRPLHLSFFLDKENI